MARSANLARRDEWTKRLARYERSARTVAEFCVEEDVSVASFYYWKKRLPSRSMAEPAAKPASFQPVQLVAQLSSSQPTLIRLANGTEIELGSDLAVVEAIVRQLIEATGTTRAEEDASC
jgi:hypothetical protein